MKKIFLFLAGFTLMVLCYAMAQGTGRIAPQGDTATNAQINKVQLNATNTPVNEENDTGIITSMNGNSSTNTQVPLSSSSASRESRNVTGNGN